MDALIAAPEHHRLLLENDRIRVLDTRIGPGETVPVHTHRWPSVLHVLAWGGFVRRDGDGEVIVDTRKSPPIAPPPRVIWSEPLPPHSIENVGTAEIRVVSIEIKDGT